MAQTHLTLSWGISRGYETYGYNIRRLRDDATGKRYRCMGGGYDMTGTVVADWLTDVCQAQLLKISEDAGTRLEQDADGKWTRHPFNDGLYGMTFNVPENRVRIDGACGIESVLRIAKAAGIDVQSVRNKRSGDLLAAIVVHDES